MTKGQETAERLRKHYSGSMSPEEVRLFRDMQAFIEFCIEGGLSSVMVLGVLAHDANGLLRQETGFTPQVTGYAKALEDLHSAQGDTELHDDLARDDKWD